MSEINEALSSGRMYLEQIEQELSDLIQSYHIGSPRVEGIWMKVTGVKDSFDNIEKQFKPKESVVVSVPPLPLPPTPVMPIVEETVVPEPETELDETEESAGKKRAKKK